MARAELNLFPSLLLTRLLLDWQLLTTFRRRPALAPPRRWRPPLLSGLTAAPRPLSVVTAQPPHPHPHPPTTCCLRSCSGASRPVCGSEALGNPTGPPSGVLCASDPGTSPEADSALQAEGREARGCPPVSQRTVS